MINEPAFKKISWATVLIFLIVQSSVIYAEGEPLPLADPLNIPVPTVPAEEAYVITEANPDAINPHEAFFMSDFPLSPADEPEVVADPISAADPDISMDSEVFPDPIFISAAPNDPYYNPYQWWLRQIEADDAWAFGRGEGVTVAVVDTGLDLDHPDIRDNLWFNEPEKNGLPGIDDDGNGFIDDINGWDFYYNDNLPSDGHLHGSHVSGIIGAVGDNNQGIIGIAPEAKILPVKVLDDLGSGFFSDVVEGIRYAVDMGAKIINMSLGGVLSATSIWIQELANAVQYARDHNAVVVAAAGNSNREMSDFYPAVLENVVSVGATDSSKRRAWFSNYGEALDIMAPGVSIMSLNNLGGYRQLSGTSMASPMVSGVLALLFSANPFLAASDAIRRLLFSGEDLGAAGVDIYYGHGLVNAFKTLSYDYFESGQIKTHWLPEPDLENRVRFDYDLEGYSLDPGGRVIQETFADGSYVVMDYWAGTLLLSAKRFYASDGTLEKTLQYDESGLPIELIPNADSEDPSKPVGAILINDGTFLTTTREVHLRLGVLATAGVDQVRYSAHGGVTWTDWEDFAEERTFSLPGGDGLKKIDYQVRDQAGRLSDIFSDTVMMDLNPPTGMVMMNQGSAFTSSTQVGVQLTALDEGTGVDQMRYSVDDGASWSAWQSFEENSTITLPNVEGTKRVLYQLRDRAGWISEILSDEIILDMTPPTGSIEIEDGASSTKTRDVLLSLTGADALSGVAQMRFSVDNKATWTDWEAFQTTRNLTLPDLEGTKEIFMQLRDGAGNILTVSDTIFLDLPPVIKAFPPTITNRNPFVLEYTVDGAAKTRSFEFPEGDKTYHFSFTEMDSTGNESAFEFDIIFKTTPLPYEHEILSTDKNGQVTAFEEKIRDSSGALLYTLKRYAVDYDKWTGEMLFYREIFLFPDETRLKGVYENGIYTLKGILLNSPSGKQKVQHVFHVNADQRLLVDPESQEEILIHETLFTGLGNAVVEGNFTSLRYYERFDKQGRLRGFEDLVFDRTTGQYLYKKSRRNVHHDENTGEIQSYREMIQFQNELRLKIQFQTATGFTITGILAESVELHLVLPETLADWQLFFDPSQQYFYLFGPQGIAPRIYDLQGRLV